MSFTAKQGKVTALIGPSGGGMIYVAITCTNETTQAELAKEINITPLYVNRFIRKNENVVNKTFKILRDKTV